MKNISRKFLIVLAVLSAPAAHSLNMITEQNPFADINKLGTVVKPDESVVIHNTNGTIRVEYAGPTKRRIIWNGESREISLMKSSMLNGIYNGRAVLEPGPLGDIYGVDYCENTEIFENENDLKKFTAYYDWNPRFKLYPEKHLRCYFAIAEKNSGFFEVKKYFFIQVIKYKLATENESP